MSWFGLYRWLELCRRQGLLYRICFKVCLGFPLGWCRVFSRLVLGLFRVSCGWCRFRLGYILAWFGVYFDLVYGISLRLVWGQCRVSSGFVVTIV